MPVQVIPDTDFFGPNIWRKRHSTRDRHCFSIPFHPSVKYGAPPVLHTQCPGPLLLLRGISGSAYAVSMAPLRSKQKVAVKPTTHIALHPYPHIPSVCAYKLVTNTVRPSSSGRIVFNLSPVAPRGSPTTRPTAAREAGSRTVVRLARLPSRRI